MLSCKWPITIIKTRPNVFTHQKLIEPHRKKNKTFLKNILLIYQMLFNGNLSDQLETIAVLKAIISVWR